MKKKFKRILISLNKAVIIILLVPAVLWWFVSMLLFCICFRKSINTMLDRMESMMDALNEAVDKWEESGDNKSNP